MEGCLQRQLDASAQVPPPPLRGERINTRLRTVG